MGTSHTILNKGFELAVDANQIDDGESPVLFDISLGTGFGGLGHSVNIEINNLSLAELEQVADRMQKIVNYYRTGGKPSDFTTKQ